MRVDLDRLAALVREVAATAITPRRQQLAPSEIEQKSPGDMVTSVDFAAEALLSKGLSSLAPGVPVVGEEAASARPELLAQVAAAPLVWLVDPLDGTANFIDGSPDFAVMVALVADGRTVAGCIHQPALGRTYTAEQGSGAYRDGGRLALRADHRPAAELTGVALTRFLPPRVHEAVQAARPRFASLVAGRMCAGVDYPSVAEGEHDFALFWRLLPWDHAAGSLLVTEAGGVARHLDGGVYRPSAQREGLLVAGGEQQFDQAASALGFII